jgi:hypothetical protein
VKLRRIEILLLSHHSNIFFMASSFCRNIVLSDDRKSIKSRKSDFATGISAMLEERPFLLCKLVARHFRAAKTRCLRILREDLGLKKFHLRWIPRTIDAPQKWNRVTLSREFLAILLQEREKNFNDIMTGDQSWFFRHYPHDSASAGFRDELPVRIKPEIDAEKCLIFVIWSVNGIHSLVDVSKGESYNSALFCDVVVPSLISDIRSRSRRKSLKGLDIHLDNACPHNSPQSIDCLQAHKARRMAQRASSPDLAPSDFFLSGYLQQKLQEVQIPDWKRLKSEIIRIFGEVGPDCSFQCLRIGSRGMNGLSRMGGVPY